MLQQLYRITAEEFQDFLRDEFDVKILAAEHEFIDPPNKIGVEVPLTLYGAVSDTPLEGRSTVALKDDPVLITLYTTHCVFQYRSKTHRFIIVFQGTPKAISAFTRSITSAAAVYCTVFTYLLHRHRASRMLTEEAARERSFVQKLYGILRKSANLRKPLQFICDNVGFEAAVCLVYSPYTGELVPLIDTDDGVRPVRVSASSLQHWDELIQSTSGIAHVTISGDHECTCNCSTFHINGFTNATFVTIGRLDEGLNTRHPRAVLSLYRKHDDPVNNRDSLLLQYAARELAAWIDEADERVEHKVLSAAISLTKKYCTLGSVTQLRREMFTPILQELSQHLTDAFYDAFPTGRRNNFKIGFVADNKPYGVVADAILQKIHKLAKNKSAGLLSAFTTDDTTSAVVDYKRHPKPTALSVHSSGDAVMYLRPHLYTWLGGLIELVYHLVLLEETRIKWVHTSVHEIRHPLQGLITFGWDFRFRVESKTASRVDLLHQLEDMESSIERMSRMLTKLESASGLDSFDVHLTPTLIEETVIRPIRRNLKSHATKKNVTIGETLSFDLLPEIYTDSDVMATLLYNLLDNAIKYSPPGGVVDIHCSEYDDGWAIDVANHGNPLSEDEANQIFEEGIRGSNVTDVDVGLGMGLFIARHVSQLLGLQLFLLERGQNDGRVVFRIWIPSECATRRQ